MNFTVAQNDEQKTIYILKTSKSVISWKEASQLYTELGGYLPYFTSKEHLKELMTLLASERLPPIEGLYIGLKHKQSNVSFAIFLFSKRYCCKVMQRSSLCGDQHNEWRYYKQNANWWCCVVAKYFHSQYLSKI